MNRSIFIAGLMGPVFLVLGTSIFLNGDMFPELARQIQANTALVIIAGAIVLVAGLAVVRLHNVWSGWPVLVTVMGWLLVIGGLLRMLLPRQLANMAVDMTVDPKMLLVPAGTLCIIGLFLSYKGYFSS